MLIQLTQGIRIQELKIGVFMKVGVEVGDCYIILLNGGAEGFVGLSVDEPK
jgi:hypothetical protein